MRSIKVAMLVVLALSGWPFDFQRAAAQEPADVLQSMSLDSLLSIQISSASKYDQQSKEAPASISIVTAEDIERFGYRTVFEILQNMRGFYGSFDRNYYYVGARGLSRPSDYNNRILLLIDGHPMNENFYNSAFVGTEFGLDLDIVERIEVVRGPGSAMYGSNAMLGVVNVVTKRGSAVGGLGLKGEVGSFGQRALTTTYGRSFSTDLEVAATASWYDRNGQNLYFPEFDHPQTNRGVAENLDWDRYFGGHGVARYKGLSLAVHATSREKGVPTGAWEMTFNDDDASTTDQRAYAELAYQRDLGTDKNIEVRAAYDWYRYGGGYPYEQPSGLWEDSTEGRWYGGEVRFRWDPVPSNRVIVGSEIRRHARAYYWSADEEDVYLIDDFPFTVYSFYAQDELQITQNLALTAGLRADHYSDAGTAVTPRGALVYHPLRSSTLKVLYGEAFRAPNRWELYYEEPTEFKRNPDLKPERIRTLELVWEQRLTEGLFGTVSLYDFRVRDLIDETVDPVDELSVYQNISQIAARGIEFELNAHSASGLGAYASYVIQKAQDPEIDERLTNSPSHQVRVGVHYPILSTVVAAANLRFDSARLTVQETETDPFAVVDLNFSTRNLFGPLRASFGIRNLFDERYATPGGFEHAQAGIAQDGRSYRLAAHVMF